MEHAEHQPALPLRRSLLLAAAAFLVCISVIEVVGGLHAIDASWLPSDSGSANLPSVGPWMPHAAARWVYLVRWEALWSLGVFGLVLVLLTIPGQHASRVAAALVLAQAVLLCVFLSVRIPLNGDQYAYVGFADLVLQGYNPYDPPLKRSARISNQLREISTVWGIVNEGATDATRRVIVRDRYGPAWTIGMAAVLYPFRNAGVEVQAHVVRAVAALAALGCSVLLWVSLRGLSWRGGALAAFALNPMIISQTAIGGHNDIIALLFGLGTYVAAMQNRPLAAGLLAALSVGTKLTFAPFLPVLLVYSFAERGLRGFVRVALASGVTVILAGSTFGLGRAWLQPLADARRYNQSYLRDVGAAVVRHLFHIHQVTGASLAPFYPAFLVIAAAGLCIAALLRMRWPVLEAVMILLIFGGGRFEPWYAIVLVPLLLVCAWWSLPLFWGISSATMILEKTNFVGGYDALPFFPFIGAAIVASLVALLAIRAVVAVSTTVATTPMHLPRLPVA